MNKPSKRDYLQGSLFVSLLRRIGTGVSSRWNAFVDRLASAPSLRRWGEEWRQAPLRLGGALVVCGILANLLTLWLLKREVGAVGLGVRILFLGLGLAGIACRESWDSVRQGSVVLRTLFPRREG